jgi:hypothetical protein
MYLIYIIVSIQVVLHITLDKKIIYEDENRF